MSAFLGPIHVKMYNRVLHQDEISQVLLALAEENGWAGGLRDQVDSRALAASTEPLETIIDQSNIHGWLNAAVAACEHRYAEVAGGILAGHPERFAELEGAMKNIGRKHGIPAGLHAEQAFQAVHDVLLDGMPCDFPFDITESSEDAVVWQVANCPHAPYWQAHEMGAEAYYRLRDAWILGALEGSGIAHARADGYHSLRKER